MYPMSKTYTFSLLMTVLALVGGLILVALPPYLGSVFAPSPIPQWVWKLCFYGGGLVVVICLVVAIFMLFWPSEAEAILKSLHSGGRGGSAKVAGRYSGAEGGVGGEGGLGSGAPGGDAEVVGDYSFARGGDGGNSGQFNGRGGRRTISQGERLNLPTALWSFGHGGAGANAPEYNRRLRILTRIRVEYIRAFPGDAVFIDAGIDQVPTRWVNKRLKEMGEAWRVSPEFKDGGYEMPPLN